MGEKLPRRPDVSTARKMKDCGLISVQLRHSGRADLAEGSIGLSGSLLLHRLVWDFAELLPSRQLWPEQSHILQH